MNVTVFGTTGQLARSLAHTKAARIRPTFLSRDDCDLRDAEMIRSVLTRQQPDFVINAAAYTAVDQAEQESEIAMAINATAPGIMAEWVAEHTAKLIHISTDFVFDGSSREPYKPEDQVAPLGSYGKSKLNGEIQVLDFAPQEAMIIRTAWVYSEYGNNFVRTMLRLMQDRDELSVVHDQHGYPTYAAGLARIIWQNINDGKFQPGIYHWSDRAEITWYEFAREIQQEALKIGLLGQAIPITDISTDQYPTPAVRPTYSVLDSSSLTDLLGIKNDDWLLNLRIALNRIAGQI